jgi:glycosyltransferase involved in cell wall biosynthesis
MLISLCTPVMNRTADLKRTMPYRIESAMNSLPVEFCILDYGSNDGLKDYLNELILPDEIVLKYARYQANHYRQAHAYNLAIMMSSGVYFCLMGADTYPNIEYFAYVRRWAEAGFIWMEEPRYKGAIACKFEEFVAAGGYDERFEFYGPEDRELADRLERRGLKKATLPRGCVGNFHTPDDVKMKNYRLKLTKEQASEMMRPYYVESVENGTLVANPKGWGRWI